MPSLTMSQLKMGWGFLLLAGILALCGRIALGHVEQATSYGLTEIIGILAVLAGQWANWAFGESRSSSKIENVDISTAHESQSQEPH